MAHDTSHDERIYLDNAATSWPKPATVYDAVDHYQRSLGAPAGRSGYAEAVEVSRASKLRGGTSPRCWAWPILRT